MTYDDLNRVATANGAYGSQSYTYDGAGNRLTRVIGTTTDTYAYSPTANQISTITTGSNVRTFAYLASGQVSSDVRDATHSYGFTGSSPVLYYIHTDQLGTPQKITDGSMNIVWDGVFDPFGNPVAGGTGSATWGSAQWGSFNWGATGPSLSLTNLRFPGQYFDSETVLNQNWNRDYDPTIGRYIQSDPISFDGGPNLYT